jgi:hypothetical protein
MPTTVIAEHPNRDRLECLVVAMHKRYDKEFHIRRVEFARNVYEMYFEGNDDNFLAMNSRIARMRSFAEGYMTAIERRQ